MEGVGILTPQRGRWLFFHKGLPNRSHRPPPVLPAAMAGEIDPVSTVEGLRDYHSEGSGIQMAVIDRFFYQ
jgi:hypothetical protein